MKITKANKLPEAQYVEMLEVAKHLRGEIVKLNRGEKPWGVYTEARKGGLRSKMLIGRPDASMINKIQKMANTKYPHLNINVNVHNRYAAWSSDGICIFIKTKN
jgi:hypothetical protein